MRLFVAKAGLLLAVVAVSMVAQAEITIGVILSTTGPAASLGQPEKNVISLGPSVIAGEKVRYVVFDDASDPTLAVQQVKRLTSEYNVDVLIGPSTSPNSLAVIDAVAESQTPMLSLASASAIVSPMDAKRRWMFKLPSNDDVYASEMVPHMVSHGVKTVSVITVDDAYGEAHTGAYKKLADEHGIKTLTIEKFLRNDTSVTAQVLHAMRGNPDAIFIAAAGTTAVTPQRELVRRGYKGKIYQSSGSVNAEFLRLGGKDVEGTYIPQKCTVVAEQLPDHYPTKKPAIGFLKAYEAKYGPRSNFACITWDALTMIEAAVPVALKHARPGTAEFRQALRTAIENIKGLTGASAVYTMSPTDHSGSSLVGMCMISVNKGTWKLEDYAGFK